jgi:predicted dehydrogenase
MGVSKFNRAIIIGCGSIGLKHLRALLDLSESVEVVDPKVIDLESLQQELRKTVKNYISLSEVSCSTCANDIAVISNWGPDHYQAFVNLVNLGFKKIILEKPMVVSLSQLDDVVSLSAKYKIHVAVNQGWHYVELAERIAHFGSLYNLGDIEAIWINGGARCMSTAGSHYIHLANRLFITDPVEIFAHFSQQNINPRSTSLVYVEGVCSILYPQGKRLSISFSNRSSVEGTMQILWRDAIGVFEGEYLSLSTRPRDRDFKDVITRYGQPTVQLFHGRLFDSNVSLQDLEMQSMYEKLSSDTYENLRLELLCHATSNKILLMSMISAKLGRKLCFDEKVSNELFNLEFEIS